MKAYQKGILQAIPAQAVYLSFDLSPQADRSAAEAALRAVQSLADGERVVAGIGVQLAALFGAAIPGLYDFTEIPGAKMRLPATPAALWLWCRDSERGALVHVQRHVQQILAPAFILRQAICAFRYQDGRDLSGYEDGTENPEGEEALQVALTADGGSFAAVQQWEHRFDKLDAMSQDERDQTIGRRASDNAELEEAPASAHVKRTAQEDFEPEAFVLRRSMPWADAHQAGLVFVAFAASFAAFEAQLRRMSGAEDGITDDLFRFTLPLTTSYFWCPPLRNGQVDWSALGIV